MNGMCDDYRIVAYEPRYRDEVVALLSLLTGSDKASTAAYFDWKHFSNPYLHGPIMKLALHQGRVVAMRGFWPGCWEAGDTGEKYFCVQDADAVVYPEHRRLGLLKTMTLSELKELEGQRYDFDITLSAAEHSSAANRKLGWEDVGELRTVNWRALRPTDWLRRAARTMPLLPALYRRAVKGPAREDPVDAAWHPFEALDRNYAKSRRACTAGIALEKHPRPAEMARLVSRHGTDGRVRHVRDTAFYAWRYGNPLSAYRFLFHERDGLAGFLVLQQPRNRKSNWAFIVDWEVRSREVFADLLHAATRWGGFDSVTSWVATVPEDLARVLADCRFNGGDKGLSPLMVKPLKDPQSRSMGGRDLLAIGNWDLRPIYSDSF